MKLFSARDVKPVADCGSAHHGQLPEYTHYLSGGFNLAEVMVAMGLITILIIGSFGSILGLKGMVRRTADSTAGMALAEAKIHDIRATLYPGTSGIFSAATTTTYTDNVSVALNSAGAEFLVPGTVSSTIQPVLGGHLVTVTVVIRERNQFLTNRLQTVVNAYSGGRGQ